MGYASKSGRARTNPASPNAHAICDRCGFRFNFIDLSWQYNWRGATMQNLRLLVCRSCLDNNQSQLRSIVIPSDPVPIPQARTQDFVGAATDARTTSGQGTVDQFTGIPIPGGNTRVDQSGNTRVTQPLGIPNALQPDAVMPLQNGKQYGVALPVLSLISTGGSVLTVTCSKPHGLATNDQISVEGATSALACGAYSVTVTTATAFTYQANRSIPAGSLLQGATRVVTIIVGLPYNAVQIPQTGI